MKKTAKILAFRDVEKETVKSEYSNPTVLFENIKQGCKTYMRGTRGFTTGYVRDLLRSVDALNTFTGKYPWEWTFDDWDNWNYSLINRETPLSTTSQRKYQNNIRQFLAYAESRETYQRATKTYFGSTINQIITQDGLKHIYEREQTEPRAHFTEAQTALFFKKLEENIERNEKVGGRELLNLHRDYMMFNLLKATGLRSSSILLFDIDSFYPNKNVPEMGQYGGYRTMGKGSKGSGQKLLSFLFDDLHISALLDWYIHTIRPNYMKIGNADEPALFLSERGTRLTYSSLYSRFMQRLNDAGLGHLALVPHSFRHSVATESTMAFGIEYARTKLGHKFSSTTQGYAHCDDAFIEQKVNKALLQQLAERNMKEDS